MISTVWGHSLRILRLLLLLGVLGASGCSSSEPVFIEERNGLTSYPCGPINSQDGSWELAQSPISLYWTMGGLQIVFDQLALGSSTIWTVDADGSRLRMVVDANPGPKEQQGLKLYRGFWFWYGFHAALSPDGTRLVYTSCEFPSEGAQGYLGTNPERAKFNYELVVINLDGSGRQRLTENLYLDHYPVWSPDGSRIAFIAHPDGGHSAPRKNDLALYTMTADGTDVQQIVSSELGGLVLAAPVWSPDGERLAFLLNEGEGGSLRSLHYGLYTVRADGSEMRSMVSHAMLVEALEGAGETDNSEGDRSVPNRHMELAAPVWSPDGGYLAFRVNEGRYRPFSKSMYTMRTDGSKLIRIAENVGSVPAWSPDGQRLAVAKYAGEAGEEVALHTLAVDGSDERLIAAIVDRKSFESVYGRYDSKIQTLSWSPDGTEILYSYEFGVCVVDLEDGQVTGLVKGLSDQDNEPYVAAWSPDGTRIAILVTGFPYDEVPPQLYTVAPDGTDRRDLITLDNEGNLVPANLPKETQ